MSTPTITSKERLYSLDLLRGLDMFFLVTFVPLCNVFGRYWGWPSDLMYQFTHPWGGFTAYDMIMPLFIFMCGAAIPLALPKRLDANGKATPRFWYHIAFRVALLWFLGMLSQGRLATLDAMQISPYNNTLQTIAAGYLIAALALLVKPRWFRIGLPVVLTLIYGIIMAVVGDYSAENNAAIRFERWVLGFIVPTGSSAFQLGNYTWFLTTLMFGAMTLLGMNCTEVLQSNWQPRKKLTVLGVLGVVLLVLGLALQGVIPAIKQVFTVTFTCKAMGVSVLLLTALYGLTDVLHKRKGTAWLMPFGQCALLAYMCHGFLHPIIDAATGIALQGWSHLFSQNTYALAKVVLGDAILVYLILCLRMAFKKIKK